MSTFNYAQYQTARAQAQSTSTANNVKVGFFKLKDNGNEALIRINVNTMEDLQFAKVHQLGAAQRWMKVSCKNEFGTYGDSCPLCAAVAAGNTSIGKAANKVYVQMMVSYKDPITQQFAVAIPVIWERPAGFASEIANLLRDYGPLCDRVFKVTRNGEAGSMQTTYSISYIPLYDKPEAVPADFSAFANFNIAKHSYWEKSVEDINTFLSTGSFPEVVRPNNTNNDSSNNGDSSALSMPMAPAPTATPVAATAQAPTAVPAFTAPVYTATTPATTPVPTPTVAPAPAADRPARNFGGFSF